MHGLQKRDDMIYFDTIALFEGTWIGSMFILN